MRRQRAIFVDLGPRASLKKAAFPCVYELAFRYIKRSERLIGQDRRRRDPWSSNP
jgi:hypothetical protein